MPKFTIEHKSSNNSDECFSKLKNFLSQDQDLKKMDAKLTCEFQDAKKTASAKGSQFKADISVKDAAQGSLVTVVVDLPLLLSPFKGKVEDVLKRKLTKHLA